jgi:hypothetical protein
MASKKSVDDTKKFFTWLRSGLRNLSRRHAPIYEALAASKQKYCVKPTEDGYNSRQKFSYKCAKCHGLFSAKEVAVDHRVDCGSLLSWDDVAGFMERLFCKKEQLDVLCHTCHDLKTAMTRYGWTEEQAIFQKKLIAFMKQPTDKVLAFLSTHGYNGTSVSNAAKRKALVEQILKETT